MQDRALAQEIEGRVAALGYELVELQVAGTPRRPILRLKIDGAEAGAGVTLEDCARVSRALEAELDARETLSPTYVLEVSSPGVERPLVRRRDFERFAGQEVALHGHAALAGRGKRLEGVLLGVEGEEGAEQVRLRLEDGDEVAVARAELKSAHLLFREFRPRRDGRGAPPRAR